MFERIIVAAATCLVALLAVSLGTLVGARRPAMALAAGWGIAVLVLTGAGTLGGLALTPTLTGLGVIALFGLPRCLRLNWTHALPVLLLGLPYLIIAASVVPAGYDEYSVWLPNILYLDRFDHFPSLAALQSVSIRPGYPPASAFVGLAVSRLTGTLAETAVIVWNALLMLAVGSLACEAILAQASGEKRWQAAAVGLLGCGILSPAFVPLLYLSNYGDAITGQLAAILVGAILLDGIVLRRWADAAAIGFGAAALVAIRQDSFSIFVILIAAWLLLVLTRRAGNPWPLFAALPAPLLTWWLWHRYQAAQIPDGAAGILPWGAWRWEDLGAILRSILAVLGEKSGYTLVLLACIGCALFGRRLTPERRYGAAFGGLLGLGHIASMIGVYLAVVTGGETARAAPEFWRFTQHIAPAVILCALPLLPLRLVFKHRLVQVLPIAAVLATCAAYPFLNIDAPRSRRTDYVELRSIAQDVAARLPRETKLALIETDADAGTIQEIFPLRYRYLVLRLDTKPSDLLLIAGTPPQTVTLAASLPKLGPFSALPTNIDYVLVTNGGDVPSHIVGVTLPRGNSYLLERGAGGFKLLAAWPRHQ